jgi:hypothetical protein
MRVIYPNGEGGIAVLIPTGELPIEEVARKDVPAGVPYRIVSVEELPADRTFRDAWSASFSAPDGFGLGPEAWFAERAARAAAETGAQT